MKKINVSVMIAVCAAASLLLPVRSSAQLGGLTKMAGGGAATAESLTADLTGGLEFFTAAQLKYAQVLQPMDKVAKYKAKLEASNTKPGSPEAKAIMKEMQMENDLAAKALLDKGGQLTAEQKQLIKEGNTEATKGVAKWAAVGVSLAMAAKSGSPDAQLGTAIPAAQEMIKDLPEIKKMLGTIGKLQKLKKAATR